MQTTHWPSSSAPATEARPAADAAGAAGAATATGTVDGRSSYPDVFPGCGYAAEVEAAAGCASAAAGADDGAGAFSA